MVNRNPKIIYIDMDDVLCDYTTAYKQSRTSYPDEKFPQSRIGFFLDFKPINGAVDAFKYLSSLADHEVYILTAPSEYNPNSYSEKRLWVEKYLGFETVPRLIISSNKGLLKGDYLIDDYIEGKGQEHFEGQLIHFGTDEFPNWSSVMRIFNKLV
jgi:5'(3')-deoxyribonucleotidase